MTTKSTISFVAALALVAGLSACSSGNSQKISLFRFLGFGALPATHVLIHMNIADSSCFVTVNESGAPVVDAITHNLSLSNGGSVDWNDTTTYPGAPPVTVSFSTHGASGPFGNASYPAGQLTGTPTGDTAGDFYFSNITVNGVQCSNVNGTGIGTKPLGVHIDR
ncbi:MAG TPA: hypothetical protein VE779_03170 [Candidatus Angelobacter sp.]|nr:hypothetical protein [Candidatus Angelobacter sp.]